VLGDQPLDLGDHRSQFTLSPMFSFTPQFGGVLHVLLISGHDFNLLVNRIFESAFLLLSRK
jgi:hypothetical protein